MNFLLYLCTLFRVLGSQVALLRGRMMAEVNIRTIGTFRTLELLKLPNCHANVDDSASRPADIIIKKTFKQCTQL